MIFRLGLLVVLVFVNSGFWFYLTSLSQEKTRFYIEAVRDAEDVQITFQKQSQMWTHALLNRGSAIEFNAYYYGFSKYSDIIQDRLFNLKMKFSDNSRISDQIQNIRDFTRSLSEGYVRQLTEMESERDAGEKNNIRSSTDETFSADPAAVMAPLEEDASLKIENIVSDIQKVSDGEISRMNRITYLVSAGSLLVLVVISVNLVFLILRSTIKTQNEMLAISSRLNSYLPPQLVNSIIEGGSDTEMKIEKRKITVCFTDLQGFTALTERHKPELIQQVLNEYLADMTTIAHAWGGMVDKFIGDGIMILFGAIEDIDETEAAYLCVRMASAMQEHMADLSSAWKGIGIDEPLSMRAGINTGFAAVGPYGPADRQTFTAVGSTVNLSSRLEGICMPGNIMISRSTYDLVKNTVRCAPMQTHVVKGFSDPVEACALILG